MRQFDIWWAELREPAGRRPVLLISRDDAYPYLNKFIAVEITSTIRNMASEVPLGQAEGFAQGLRCQLRQPADGRPRVAHPSGGPPEP